MSTPLENLEQQYAAEVVKVDADEGLLKRLERGIRGLKGVAESTALLLTYTSLFPMQREYCGSRRCKAKAACNIAKVDEMLQPRQPLLAGLRYLSLLYEGKKQDAKGILAMKRGRRKGEADLERDYYPHMLKIFQAAAVGQPEIQFQLEDTASADSAQPDLQCFVNGVESHPGEAKARNVSSNPITDPDGIHNNREAFGKLHKVIRAKFLSPEQDQIAHHKLVENELMIHHIVDATVPYVLKSDLDVFGSVEGAGLGWSFLKLQHIGNSFQAVPLTMLPHYWSCAQQAVMGLHMAGVLHRDVKPGNMLIINNDLFLNDFDVSCLTNSSDATLRSRVGTEDFRSPLWQEGKQYKAVDDLASLVLSFAWLLNMRTESSIERIKWVAKLPAAPESMVKIADDVLRMFQEESGRALLA
ncbi:MAG: hypothetical protein FRX49_08779 [Trebouxia sp. A1-2]|nr:MAG: hypothetical protein FRX49_08779 [Trebouxia sp. A1-2]